MALKSHLKRLRTVFRVELYHQMVLELRRVITQFLAGNPRSQRILIRWVRTMALLVLNRLLVLKRIIRRWVVTQILFRLVRGIQPMVLPISLQQALADPHRIMELGLLEIQQLRDRLLGQQLQVDHHRVVQHQQVGRPIQRLLGQLVHDQLRISLHLVQDPRHLRVVRQDRHQVRQRIRSQRIQDILEINTTTTIQMVIPVRNHLILAVHHDPRDQGTNRLVLVLDLLDQDTTVDHHVLQEIVDTEVDPLPDLVGIPDTEAVVLHDLLVEETNLLTEGLADQARVPVVQGHQEALDPAEVVHLEEGKS